MYILYVFNNNCNMGTIVNIKFVTINCNIIKKYCFINYRFIHKTTMYKNEIFHGYNKTILLFMSESNSYYMHNAYVWNLKLALSSYTYKISVKHHLYNYCTSNVLLE